MEQFEIMDTYMTEVAEWEDFEADMATNPWEINPKGFELPGCECARAEFRYVWQFSQFGSQKFV